MAEIKVMHAGPLVSRAEAMASGAPRYFTGKPCRHGHVAERKTASKVCLGCRRIGRPETPGARNGAAARIEVDALPKTCSEARATGAKHYFSGRPCVHRHVAPRTTATGNCVECNKARIRRWAAESGKTTADFRREYAARHPERTHASHAKWWAGKGAEWQRGWRDKNPDLVIAHRTNRRVREAGGSFTAEEFAALVKRQNHRCPYCRADLRKVRPSPDHRTPLSKGGTNDISNIQATCFPCNRKKQAADPIDFARRLGLLI